MPNLRGQVRSGIGDFAQWIEKLHELYQQKTGLNLFPGTLNLELENPYDLPADSIRLEGSEYGGRVSLSLQPCRILGRRAFILRTDGNAREQGHHPKTVIEIATDVKLRDAFHLKDGDWVEVEI